MNSAAKTSVSSGAGRFSATAGSTLTATLAQVAASDVDVHAVVSFDKLPNQYLNFLVNTRVIGSAAYGARVRLNANGSAVLQLMRDGTALAGGTVAGLTVPAQAKLHIRTQATAASPTTLRAKVWLDGSPEPAAWQAVATDSTSALQGTGALGLAAYVSSSTTNGPVTVSVEDIVVNAVP